MAEEAENFGAQIKQRREALGLTQRELAQMLPGKTEGKDISRYETGKHMPGENTRRALAKALGTTVGALYVEPARPKLAAPDPFAADEPAYVTELRAQLNRIEATVQANRQTFLDLVAERDGVAVGRDDARKQQPATRQRGASGRTGSSS